MFGKALKYIHSKINHSKIIEQRHILIVAHIIANELFWIAMYSMTLMTAAISDALFYPNKFK